MTATIRDVAGRLLRGVVDQLPEGGLEARLAAGRPLVVKLGADPTAPDLHLGHTVVLRKMRAFQDLGHTAVFLIGDFTATIGDPSGRDQTRPTLSADEVARNAETYKRQVFRILDPERTIIRSNSEWLGSMSAADLVRLAGTVTVARLLERDDFAARHRDRSPISLREFLYPLLQGYDSVALRADVEIGGTDQIFNLLMGRAVQEAYGQAPQVVLTLPLLLGLDGARKMSKSFGNHIALEDPPDEMYGKTMSIPDALMESWYTLLTDVPPGEFRAAIAVDPRAAKARLAREIVAQFHGAEAAAAAEARFDRLFRHGGAPDDAPERAVRPGEAILDVVVGAGLAPSKSEARRLVAQGAVEIDGVRIDDPAAPARPGLLKVGKRRFLRLRIG